MRRYAFTVLSKLLQMDNLESLPSSNSPGPALHDMLVSGRVVHLLQRSSNLEVRAGTLLHISHTHLTLSHSIFTPCLYVHTCTCTCMYVHHVHVCSQLSRGRCIIFKLIIYRNNFRGSFIVGCTPRQYLKFYELNVL